MRILSCSLICLALIAGCMGKATDEQQHSTSKPVEGTGTRKLKIAVIPKGTTHVFWKSVHAGAVQAAKDLGDVEILWKGPLLENDRDGQINVMQDFIANRVDGICLAPLDKQALIGPVKDSKEAGIPVVIFDSALQDDSAIVSYVATDNRKGGELAAQQMAQLLGEKGNVILLRYNAGSESTEQREEAFLETLQSQFPQIEVISSKEYAGTTPEQSLDKATQVLSNFKDRVDGIFAVCEPNANGILIALKETQLAGKVKFVAFDPSEELIRAMGEGVCHGIVLQDPITMGYQSVQAIVKSIRGETVEKRIGTGEFLATPENMTTPKIEKLLSPDRI